MAEHWIARTKRALVLVAASSVVLVAACSGASAPTTVAEPAALEFDDLADRIEQESIEVDRLATECMAALGFTYIPPDYGPVVQPVPTPEDPNDREYAQRWGYGVLTGIEAEQPWLNVMTTEDVQRQLDALKEQTDGEGRSYNVALYGSESPRPGATGDTGCWAEAVAVVNAMPGSLALREELFEEASVRLAADPRVAELDAVWSRCMNESGYDFARSEDIVDMFLEIAEGFFRQISSISGTIVDTGDGPTEVPPDPDRVAAFVEELTIEADRERAHAVADRECFVAIADEYAQLEQAYFGDLGG